MLRRFRYRCEKGQDVVEYAFVLPLLMLLMLGIVEFGLAVWRLDTVANVTREVARCGIIYSEDWNDRIYGQCIPEAIQFFGLGLSLAPQDFIVDRIGDTIRVEVNYTYRPIIASITGGDIQFPPVVTTMRNEY
jgi:hypothetical protein